MRRATVSRTRLMPNRVTCDQHFCSDLAVDVGPDSLRYPDAIVDSIGAQRALVATGPVLIAEVLSPSSATLR